MGGTLDLSRCKEEFSVAYVHAIASAAGYALERRTVDAYGVDLELINGSFRIDVQMKCTNEADEKKATFFYQLDARTYNFLADPDRTVPGFVFVVEVPKQQSQWLGVGAESLSLSRLCYYREMTGLALVPDGQQSKAVSFDRKHFLTVDALAHIMATSKKGARVHPAVKPLKRAPLKRAPRKKVPR